MRIGASDALAGLRESMESERVLILGGTFNPVHAGHLRLVIEAREATDCDHVLLVPGFSPHYRAQSGLLDFELRLDLARAALGGMERAAVLDIERRLPQPVFSYDMLTALRAERPGDAFHFVVGIDQFLHMGCWHRGTALPDLARIVVAMRDGTAEAAFHHAMKARPDWKPARPPSRTLAAYQRDGGGEIVLIGPPRLDISSSLIRARWREGRDISHLVPETVLALLRRHEAAVSRAWAEAEPDDPCRRRGPPPHLAIL